MGRETEILKASSQLSDGWKLVINGGLAGILLAIIMWLGNGMLENQEEMTKAFHEGNATMMRLVDSNNVMANEVRRAVEAMKEETRERRE